MNNRQGQVNESNASQESKLSTSDIDKSYVDAVTQVQTSDLLEYLDTGAHQIQSEPTLQDSSPTVTFYYTGNYQSYTIPAGVTTIGVSAYGASGGGGSGGLGGNVQCTVYVNPGQTYYVFVGASGGWNGGGPGANGWPSGGGGTGRKLRCLINHFLTYTHHADFRTTTGYGDYGNRLVVAGAGGGQGYNGGGGKGVRSVIALLFPMKFSAVGLCVSSFRWRLYRR